MSGVVGWSRSELLDATARELNVAYEAKLIQEWDHTATTASLLHNLIAVMGSTKQRPIKPMGFFDFHPYRKKEGSGRSLLTAENFDSLKAIGEALCGGGRR